jgi:hypothetical protein
VSRICEEFQTDIHGAYRQPLPTAIRIIELRDYERTKALWDNASPEQRKALPRSPMLDRVKANERKANKRLLEQRGRGA